MKLTEKQIIDIIKNNQISKCTKDQKKQVMNFAFGDEYMNSNEKGSKKQITERIYNGSTKFTADRKDYYVLSKYN